MPDRAETDEGHHTSEDAVERALVLGSNAVEALPDGGLARKAVFIVLVCYADGMVTLTFDDVTEILTNGESEQVWIRVDRRKNEWYSVSGGTAELRGKRPQGVQRIIQALVDTRYA